MKSSVSLVLIAAAVLAVSLGLKIALAQPPAEAVLSAKATRGEALRRFLVANAGPVQRVGDGWRLDRGRCQLMAFPSQTRGSLDLDALQFAGPHDHIAYVYRGDVSDRRPKFALALDIVAYMATKPFRGGAAEPGYVVLVARDCPALPQIPWNKLPS